MERETRRDTIWCDSSDRKTQLHGYLWMPPAGQEVRAVVQIVHGMAEHVGRYDDFACFLADRGFVVFGHDQLGHGRSVTSVDDLGHIPLENGAQLLMDDVHRVRVDLLARLAEQGISDLPLYLFGHSMGSLVVRAYLARHAYGVSGAILCGTTFMAASSATMVLELVRVVARMRGERHRSSMLQRTFIGAFNQDIEDPETPVDWISFNRENIERYLADERCGHPFTTGGYAALADLLRISCSKDCVAAYPDDLPLLFIGGTEDPVGEMGMDVSRAADFAHAAGVVDVRCRLYAGMRHEVLNELGHQVVYDDIAGWIEGHLA